MGTNKRVYRARAIEAALGKTGTGKEQICVSFTVLTPGADVNVISWFGFFTDATFERTIQSLRYCGWEGTDLSDLAGIDANEVDLVIEDEEWEGRIGPKVQWVNRPGGVGMKAQLEPDEARAFAASMKGRILAMGKAPAARSTPQRPPASTGRTGGVLSPEPPPIASDPNGIPF